MKFKKVTRSRLRTELKKFGIFKFKLDNDRKITKVYNAANENVINLYNNYFEIINNGYYIKIYYHIIELIILKSDFNYNNLIIRIFILNGQSLEFYLDLFELKED